MTREEAKDILYEWQEMMVRNGVPIDTSKVQALRVAIEALQREEAEEKGYCHRIKPKGGGDE